MKRIALVCLLLLLTASLSQAAVSKYVSKSDAEAFVSTENHYLEAGETASADLFITRGNSSYWVVTIKRGESPIAFVAVEDAESPVIPESSAINRELFRSTYVLWSFRNIEDALKKQNNWFFTLTNVSSFNDLARFLDNEKTDLDFIYSAVTDLTIRRKVSSMKSGLDGMSASATEISNLISSTIELENKVFAQPSVSDLPVFTNAFSLEKDDPDSILFKLESLVSAAIDYDGKEVAELKDLIAQSSLDLSEKDLLVNKASAPFTVSSLTSLRTTLSSNKQSLDDVFLGLEAKVNNFLDSFEKRKEMSQAYQVLYGKNEGIESAAKGQLSTLSDAANDVLYSNKRQYWAAQATVNDLEKQWRAAERSFEEDDFSSALTSALKAVNDVKKIYQEGFAVEEEPGIDTALIQNVIIILIALLVLLIAVRYRARIASFFKKPEEGEEEVELES